jgi:predicted N-acetyltransferase YhbS
MQAPSNTINPPATNVIVRRATPEDADRCGQIFYDAFESIAARHNFPVEPGSPDFTRFKAGEMLTADGFAGFVAERAGEVLGCAFIDERAVIAGIGPVAVDPVAHDDGIGRALMEVALRRQHDRGAAGIRLVQTAYHYRSLGLYIKLGFAVREPISVLQGTPPVLSVPSLQLRLAEDSDVPSCNELCFRVHGHDRDHELRDAISAGTAHVGERAGRISGYATGFGYGWHAVSESNEDLLALLASADTYLGLGILVPSRNAELLASCLDAGMRIVQQSTLMTIGLYNEPAGAYLPSILF